MVHAIDGRRRSQLDEMMRSSIHCSVGFACCLLSTKSARLMGLSTFRRRGACLSLARPRRSVIGFRGQRKNLTMVLVAHERQCLRVQMGLNTVNSTDFMLYCRKLRMINNAQDINDLRIPLGNQLEKLKGNLSDYYSIRINKQWRIIFKWIGSDAYEVQIIDYH